MSISTGDLVVQYLTIDIVDAAQNLLIWQSEARRNYRLKERPERKERQYHNMVQKALRKFPPRPRKK